MTASAVALDVRKHYLNVHYGVKSWLLTTDHKRIAVLYMISNTFMFVIGGIAATVMRLELLTPAGDLVESDTYNKLFTVHGLVMIFFFLVPSIPAVLGNFLIPLMIGARDLAFPRLNLLSWYVYLLAAVMFTWVLLTGGIDTGWTFYTPFSSSASNTRVIPAALAIFVAGFSSILTGLNFIATIHKMRAPGLTWMRLPLFIWSLYATSVIMVLATPVLGITLLLLA
ncbi:MAG: cytochrome c oxidase subunit I, partial [Ardenticatenaceae bacterium]